jgi:hypothetical protein
LLSYFFLHANVPTWPALPVEGVTLGLRVSVLVVPVLAGWLAHRFARRRVSLRPE